MKNLKFCQPLVLSLKKGLAKRFQRYMTCENCQISAVLIPKFILNWAKPHDKVIIRQGLIDYLISDNEKDDNTDNSLSLPMSIFRLLELGSDSEDDFLQFGDTVETDYFPNNNVQMLVDTYLSNTLIKTPNDLPLPLKKAYIRFNTAIPSSAPVERLFSAGGQLMEKRKGKMADKNFEMTLLQKYNKYFNIM
ncbi:unnamed protein product [Macrosiphum euphorbiae]|uniref:HAT C-terminal dimerisation domain-containing protein n=1 Tax=Macrosiphum euphorbiae TaxID=13131 RepID=A0AAV0YAQ1_9HEMI|nr:unnamed protein product [Macrosiphum euphorbiae]